MGPRRAGGDRVAASRIPTAGNDPGVPGQGRRPPAGIPAFAADGPESAGHPGTKLARGIANATTGWLEAPKQTALGGQDAGLPGLGGGLEAATFWAPNGPGYAPILHLPTVFEDR